MSRFYYNCKGKSVGPLNWMQLKSHARKRMLTEEGYVRKELNGNWVRAQTIPDLFNVGSEISDYFDEEDETDSKIERHEIGESTKKKRPSITQSFEVKTFKLTPYYPYLLMSVSAAIFIVAALPQSQYLSLVCYPAIIGFASGITLISERLSKKRKLRIAGITACLLLLGLWGSFDQYTSHWMEDNVRYSDTYHRWTGQHIYRALATYEDPETARKDRDWQLAKSTLEGPISKEGVPHGRWFVSDYSSYKGQNLENISVTTKFYWFGKEISQNQWQQLSQN